MLNIYTASVIVVIYPRKYILYSYKRITISNIELIQTTKNIRI
ncbi:hypothetical protein XIS1_460082 [Xenorhabdus innexi]|uniref:Uncharacterized protein n=1 Tax=Xenorhabdus innexi TaxID=290109 RepID=A0A1N6MYA6_9GAMM|nr:hypothetical protein XIS1_460082 [Xenorhabdus innexi]